MSAGSFFELHLMCLYVSGTASIGKENAVLTKRRILY